MMPVATGDRLGPYEITAVIGLIAIAVLAVAASSGCRSRASDDEAVRAASRAWDRAHNAGDAAALGRLYAENAVSMPNNRPALEGRLAPVTL
jgi:hypothetical protein